jgi:subtilisin family serine protease
MKKLITLILLLCGLNTVAQIAPHKYYVQFTDKNQNPYSLNHPEDFLTQRSIQRRLNQGIGYDEKDLPVTPAYIQAVQNIGAEILNPTKWLNGTTIYLADTNLLAAIRNFPFVGSITKFAPYPVKNNEPVDKFRQEKVGLSLAPAALQLKSTKSYNYGESYTQIHQVNGDAMHDSGFTGQGIVIAQLDAGFYHVNQHPAFDSLYAHNQILGNKDFLHNGMPFFDDPNDVHGMWVLSIMGGNLPGHLIGAAPRASFWMLRTEEIYHEYQCEEYNWVSGAEFADSVGADIITSSLGYTTFDSLFPSHTCADMNGHSTVAAFGANTAFSRGIVIVVSAGNEGNNMSWRCVSTPADADYAMAIAAVDGNGTRASFSSVGVDTAGRVKPNLAAMGAGTVIADAGGSYTYGNGTSFSAPIIAGMSACLLQATPSATSPMIKSALEQAGSQYSHPDSLLGYGIPDTYRAMIHMGINNIKGSNSLNIYPNPFVQGFFLQFNTPIRESLQLTFCDAVGRIIQQRTIPAAIGENKININTVNNIPAGIYFIRLNGNSFNSTTQLIKLPQ